MIYISQYYHGTIVGGLTILNPFANPHSNLKEAAVYLSTNKALASIYIWNKAYKWMTFNIREDGMPVYTESHKGALQELYDGVMGYIYTCEGDYSTDNKTGIKLAAVSYEPVVVSDCEVIRNAYTRIMEFEKSGELIIRRFDDLTEQEHTMNRNMVLGAIKRLNLLKGDHPLSAFVEKHFPTLWIEALEDSKMLINSNN